MKLKDVLKDKGRTVHSITPTATINEALALMNVMRVGSLMVIDDKGIQGILSERDILRCVGTVPSDFRKRPVGEAMTPKERLIVAHQDDDLNYVMTVMTEKRIRHVPVVDERGSLEGIVSVGDIVKALMVDKDIEIKYLLEYIEGKYPC